MFNIICSVLVSIASFSACTSCSDRLWGETEMPEALKKLNEN